MSQDQWIALGWTNTGYLAVPLTGLAVRYLFSLAKRASTDQHNATLVLLGRVAVMAVTYVEQALQNKSNFDRKAAALRFVDNYLKQHGISLPVFEIEAAIESAVLTETQHGDKPPSVAP